MISSVMEENMYKRCIKDVSECIVTGWNELDQQVIDIKVSHWHSCLQLCQSSGWTL